MSFFDTTSNQDEIEASELETEYRVRVEDPRYEQGFLIDIPGLGSVRNYEDKILEPYQVHLFVEQGYAWPEDNFFRIIKDAEGRYESHNPSVNDEDSDPVVPDEEVPLVDEQPELPIDDTDDEEIS